MSFIVTIKFIELFKPCNIFPMGDSAVTIELADIMDEEVNEKVLSMKEWFLQNKFPGLLDLIVAYSSLTVLYDPFIFHKVYGGSETVYNRVREKLEQAYRESVPRYIPVKRISRIPVCYDHEYGPDLQAVCSITKLRVEEIIHAHISKVYRVYMMGFLPGFTYMGKLDPALVMPRKQIPVPVKGGSVAIVSDQTGIYPIDSPGGWQIIGRTPVHLFNASEELPVMFSAGDEIQFYEISRGEFQEVERAALMQNA